LPNSNVIIFWKIEAIQTFANE